ncbi:YciI family protein [Ottowia thiooxydans]|uniref:YciI family protein n=1 Tax=Ottowia thiooxydans TaxID=219182 RepID=UPI000414F01C|nr:YciI family protein [Ottowia thiooxydans]
MNEYILLMHQDSLNQDVANDLVLWGEYLATLRKSGQFDGGSSIGDGERFRKNSSAAPSRNDLGGFIRVRAASLEDAKVFLPGNPVYEAGGTVEIRLLPQS